MTPREAVLANIEYRSEGRIGFNFGGQGRLNDFTSAGLLSCPASTGGDHETTSAGMATEISVLAARIVVRLSMANVAGPPGTGS